MLSEFIRLYFLFLQKTELMKQYEAKAQEDVIQVQREREAAENLLQRIREECNDWPSHMHPSLRRGNN